jgi:hypothetical protein
LGEITWGTATAILTAPLVFLLPGGALLSLLLPPRSFTPGHRPDAAVWLSLAAGLTVALTPVGLLLLHLAGLAIGPALILAALVASASVIALRQGPQWWRWLRTPLPWRERLAWLDAPLLALALVMLLGAGVRLWVVRGVNVGFWGDSYQHTMIARLLLDNGGLFQSWQPYAPLSSFTYHFGFHGNVALFEWATGWLTGVATPRNVVLVGQFFNALSPLTLYPLAVRLSANRWTGVATVLFASLLSPMPMQYVNWGRYTQLAGQVILPIVLWLVMEALDHARPDLRRWLLAGFALAGLGLTHYRIVFFAPCFLLPYLAWRLWHDRHDRRRLGQTAAGLAVIGGLSLAIMAPWLWNLFRGEYPAVAASVATDPTAVARLSRSDLLTNPWPFVSWPLALLGALGALLALWRRAATILVAAWMVLLLLLANPYWLGLPGTGLVDNFGMIIGLYMPVSMLAGYAIGEGIALASLRWRPAKLLAVLVIVGLGLAGTYARASVLNPNYQMVTPGDEAAMAWIEANTSPDARFLVNGFLAFEGNYVAGTDAGWWIPLLTGRGNTVPPLTYASEASAEPDYVQAVGDLARYVENTPLDDPATVAWLQQQGITHIYIGVRRGHAGDPDEPLLDAASLQASPYYRIVYQQQGVTIFELTPEGEPGD